MIHDFIFNMTHLLDIFALAANITLIVTVYILFSQSRKKNKIASIQLCRDLLNLTGKGNKLKETNNFIVNND